VKILACASNGIKKVRYMTASRGMDLRYCLCVQDQLTAAMNIYVEEALGLHVGDLVRFVRAAEAAAKQQNVPEGLPVPGYGPPEAAPIMKDFASRWTSAIEALNKCVSSAMVPCI